MKDDFRTIVICECGKKATRKDGYCNRCRNFHRADTERKVGGVFLAFVILVVAVLVCFGIL